MINLEFLKQFGLNSFELRALSALINLKSAKASDICKEGNIPTSKIYLSLSKLIELGVAEEINLRPKLYSLVSEPELYHKLEQLIVDRNQHFSDGIRNLRREIEKLANKDLEPRIKLGIAQSFEIYRDRYLSMLGVVGGKIYSFINLDEGFRKSVEAFTDLLHNKQDPNAEHIVLVYVMSGIRTVEYDALLKDIDAQVRITRLSLGANFHFWDQDKTIQTFGNSITGVVGSYYIENEDIYTVLYEGFMEEWYQASVL